MKRDVSLIDRVFLMGSRILWTRRISKQLKVYVRKTDIVLKFHYRVNLQYHVLNEDEIASLNELFGDHLAGVTKGGAQDP